jgi:hypothetical protein
MLELIFGVRVSGGARGKPTDDRRRFRPTMKQLTGERPTGICAVTLVAIFFGILWSALWAGPTLAQTAGAASLSLTPGARADGMGRAFVALPTDAASNWWNPAGLAYEKGRVFTLMHTQLVPDLADDVYYENLGYAMHLPGWGGIGASLVYLGYGKSMATREDGIELGMFTSYEISPQVHIGTEVMKGLAAGLTLKYVYVNLAPSWATPDGKPGTGDTFAADIGVLLRLRDMVPTFPMPVNFGVNVQNLGPNIAYIDEDQSDPIGRNVKIGVGAQVLNLPKLTGIIAYDFNKSLVVLEDRSGHRSMSDQPIHDVGAEITYGEFVSARAGYIYDKQGDIRDPTFGVGFLISLGSNNLGFDYASVPQAKVLDRVNKFSITFRF